VTHPSDVGPGGPNPQQYLPQPPYHQPPYVQHQHVQQSPYELQGVYAGAPEPPRRHAPVWIWVAIGVAATVAVAVLVVFVTRDEHPASRRRRGAR
jgi:hypothetical protein